MEQGTLNKLPTVSDSDNLLILKPGAKAMQGLILSACQRERCFLSNLDGSLALGLRLFCKHRDTRDDWYCIELPRCSRLFGLHLFANVITGGEFAI